MEFSTIRPILSGLIGAAIAAWFLRKISRWVPATCSGRPIDEIMLKHRWKVRGANTLGFAALFGGIALYQFEFFQSNDWRGIGLAFGAACVFPPLFLILTSASKGREAIQEALVSYAVGQDTPPLLLNTIMVVGTVLFFVTLASLI